MINELQLLKKELNGELEFDKSTLICYSTDASVYKETPLAVAFPKDEEDIIKIIHFAHKHHIFIIPRAAGTSLAGQVVGKGLVIDISRYFNKIIEVNESEHYAMIQPGVVRDELNLALASKGLFFAPETATSNRCMIGGMCGNNSCGANSLIYGSTRQHILAIDTILSDGSKARFEEISEATFQSKCQQTDFEGIIYQSVYSLLNNQDTQEEIRQGYPDKDIKRRSMGYAIDELIDMEPFTDNGHPFNFSSLLTGSEGTLAIITAIKVNLTPLPPKYKALLSVETDTMEAALEGNIITLPFQPAAIELIDKTILDLAKTNITQNKNRFFIHGDPAAILIIELNEESEEEINHKITRIKVSLGLHNIGTNYTIIKGSDINKVWALRKAGLGIMSNMKGDGKPTTVVEDIAIHPAKYPQFYAGFKALLEKYNLKCAYYAHISTGELHNKPVFNLKKPEEVQKFREFAKETAVLVKQLGGSLSGEHGDGRLRGEFLSLMIGEKNYTTCQAVKNIFDPDKILNIGKIVDAPKINEFLRTEVTVNGKERATPDIATLFDFSDTDGILRAIEKCNGSADCKRSHLFGGNMCPTYQVTLDERQSTRARANLLREFVYSSGDKKPFNHSEIKEALDLCLACKACKSECPSNVDMTKLRAEFLYQYYQQHPKPFRSWLIANYPIFNDLAIPFAGIYNFIITNKFTASLFKKCVNFAKERSLPTIERHTLKHWARHHLKCIQNPVKTVYLFNDEFTDTQDVKIGIAAIELLQSLNYQVKIINHSYSGRTYLSKGFLKTARKIARKNIEKFSILISQDTPLIGIEPSAILSFRDEYPEIVGSEMKAKARELAKNVFLIDEFIADEFERGMISREDFTTEKREILFHSHCYQKALSNIRKSIIMMEIPENYHVEEIQSGCCGMAGAFGYEKEHFEFSMKVGELSLFPAIRGKSKDTIITATGTSCRHQIKDGTGEHAMHPLEILWQAKKKRDESK